MTERLNQRTLKALVNKPGRYSDPEQRGLFLQVRSPTNCSWLFRYQKAGQHRLMGLGSLADVGLEEARRKALRFRQQIADGLDPFSERERERTEREAAAVERAAMSVTFQQAAQEYYDKHRGTWKNEKHAAQFLSTLEAYAYPTIGKMIVGCIQRKDIIKALEKDDFWNTKNETADRVRSRIKRVLDYAATRDLRSGTNPAEWTGNLEHVLPAPAKVQEATKRKQPSLDWKDLPGFMTDLRDCDGTAARALEFLILCASRTGDVIGSLRSEIDWDNAVWTIPAARMKASKEDHRVPLSDDAMAILNELPTEKGNPFLFIGMRKGGLSNMAMNQLLKRMGSPTNTKGETITVHGFRSTFRDWVADDPDTRFSRDLAEAALAHVLGKVEAAYQRSDRLAPRRKMMDVWADFCAGRSPKDNVVPFKGQAA